MKQCGDCGCDLFFKRVPVVVCLPVQLAPWLAAEVPHLVDGGFITAS